jgi:hypothetical protein
MNEDQWIEKLNPGDTVFMWQPYGCAPKQTKVTRKTAKMIFVVGAVRGDNTIVESNFWIKNGRSVGANSYYSSHLIQDSPNVRERVELDRLKQKANYIREHTGTPHDKETLLKFIAAMEPFMKKPLRADQLREGEE